MTIKNFPPFLIEKTTKTKWVLDNNGPGSEDWKQINVTYTKYDPSGSGSYSYSFNKEHFRKLIKDNNFRWPKKIEVLLYDKD